MKALTALPITVGNGNGAPTDHVLPVSTTAINPTVGQSDTPETKIITFKISSTNDLSYPYFSSSFQAISAGIQLFQSFLLILIIAENHTGKLDNTELKMRFGQLFIFWYLTMYLPGELCNSLKFKMRIFYFKESESGDNLILRSKTEKSLKEDLIDSLKFVALVLIQSFKSAFQAWIFTFSELFCPGDDKLLELPVPLHSRYFRLCGVSLEPFNVTLVVIAAVYVSNAQQTLINLLFNFSGIIIVAELDEIMVSVLPKYQIPVRVPVKFENERRSFTQVTVEQGFVMYVGFVLMVAFISSA